MTDETFPGMAAPRPRSIAHAFARTDTSRLGVWWWRTDHLLMGATFALVIIGIILQFGTSPAETARIGIAWPFHFAVRQLGFGLLAAALIIWGSMLGPRRVKQLAAVTYIAAVLSMLALPFIGHAAKGATRWIEFGGLTLQPSEFMKPALVILVAWMFAEGKKGEGVPGVTIAFALYAVPVVLLLTEPDIGQTILTTAAFGAAFWMAGVPVSWILGLGGVAVVGLSSTYFLFEHVATRVSSFLGHEHVKTTEPAQVKLAALAIAHGGPFGRGPGEGIMKTRVPDMHTDFAYSAAAEEYGLWLSLLIIGLFALIVVRGLYKAMRLVDPFEQIAAAGLFVLVGAQAFINLAVNLDLAPTKGMTLPFISYGGTSMLATGLTMGLALALIAKRPRGYGARSAFPATGSGFE
jgi:cell division protein FtsW